MIVFKSPTALACSLVLVFYVAQVHGSLDGKRHTHRLLLTLIASFKNIDSEIPHHDSSMLTLEEKINIQKSTFHWYPYQRIMYHVLEDGTFERTCPPPGSSIEEFPQFLTRKLMKTPTLLTVNHN